MLIEENKLITLALKDIHPFNVDLGIYCGGYQGPLYPNPSRFNMPGFNPLDHRSIIMSEYEMHTGLDPYVGLGSGNPSINYLNPGHILGLFDTFARMSYGINIINHIRSFLDSANIGPIINFGLPTILNSFESDPILMSDLYPNFSEIPSDYINNININTENGKLTPLPTVNVPYIPQTSLMDAAKLNVLFANKSTFSYVNMPIYFINIISDLYNLSQGFSQEVSANFEFIDAENFKNYAPNSADADVVLESTGPDSVAVEADFAIFPTLEVKHKCHVLDPLTCLKIFNGDDNYRMGPVPTQNEYRSLTQLNSVVNLIPIQTVAARLETELRHTRFRLPPGINEVTDNTARSFHHVSFIISELILNISLRKESNISIESIYNIQTPIINYDNYGVYVTDTTFPLTFGGPCATRTTLYSPEHIFNKKIQVFYSLTNKFSWDKSWFDLPTVFDSFNDADTFSSGGIKLIPDMLPDPLGGTFSKTINLGIGHHILRVKHVLQNNYFVQSSEFVPSYQKDDLTLGAVEGCPPRFIRAVYDGEDPVIPEILPDATSLTYNITGDGINISHSISI